MVTKRTTEELLKETRRNFKLGFAKKLISFGVSEVCRKALEKEFPELTEDEDERARKALLRCCDDWEKGQFGCMVKEDVSAIRAYLEKQKELTKDIKPGYPGHYVYDGEKMHFLGNPAMEEKQKEQKFTHHEIDESLQSAVAHQMEDDGDVDDFVRKGIDDIVLKYARLGARWQKEQSSAKWSEEDKRKLNRIYEILGQAADAHAFSTTCRLIGDKEAIMLQDFLRSIVKPQITEWSEEDEEIWQDIFDLCNRFGYDDACRLLKYISRKSWKPSEEQMEALDCVAGAFSPNNKEYKMVMHHINTLRNILKQL